MSAEHDIVHGIPIRDIVRTDLHCHQCSKSFVAQLDFSVDGNHIIECPYCLHEHCRTIKDGIVTGDRWDSQVQYRTLPRFDSSSAWPSQFAAPS